MSMAWIRKTYGVPAKRGGRVEYTGCGKRELGTITSARHGCLNIRLDGEKYTGLFHPTWELRFLPADEKGQARHWRLIEFNPRRAMRDAPAARVEVDQDGEWLWMTPRDIRLNIRDHGDHPELRKALAAYGCAKGPA